MLKIRQFSFLLLAFIAASTLILAACQPTQGSSISNFATAIPPAAVQTSAPAAENTAASIPVTGPNSGPTSGIPETITPAVQVVDQSIANGVVTVDEVVSPGPGWIVIHINSGGSPGPIIGWTQVNSGVNTKVPVKIDTSKATPVLYAMLHVDAGVVGTYEFPGPDVPLQVNGQMISPAFGVTAGVGASAVAATEGAASPTAAPTAVPSATAAAPTQAPSGGGGYNSGGGYSNQPAAQAANPTPASSQATIFVANHPKLGKILVDARGMTLYVFKKDAPGVSNCTGGCLESWPPLLTSSGSPSGGPGASGKLTTITRSDHGTQVAYNDQPLYYFAGDQAPGAANGQGIGNSWFAATP